MSDLLIELFSEEIPARMQAKAADDLKRLVTNGLVEAGLTYASAGAFSTPRRLVLTVEGLNDRSADVREERKGPRTDAPEKALEGFLRSTGLTKDQLEERDDKKGAVWFAIVEKPGRAASEIVAEVLDATIRNFPWPKSMRWGNGSLRWVRPLHSILCILSAEDGAEVVPLDVDGIVSGDVTFGHRFLAPDAIKVVNFDDCSTKLKRAYVVLDASERAEAIWADATNQAFANGLEVIEDRGLLAEVAGLVEWPVVLMGPIAKDYLNLPSEVLQLSMKEHQKFFSVKNPKTGRIEQFITVANIETADNGATILAGNGRVLSARLADGKFFWENDLREAKSGMKGWLQALENVTFHNKLGSVAEQIERISDLSGHLAATTGADPVMATTAAQLSKADLSSEMVYEFPELQGVMGRYYSAEAGHDAAIGAAIEEHYSPLGPSDDVPTAPVSMAVALAAKVDTLAGFWVIDEKPTGSKDPFALRRAALGVIRLAVENDLRFGLRDVFARQATVVSKAQDGSDGVDADAISDSLMGFVHDRLKVYLKDRGVKHDVIDASVAMPGNDDLSLLVRRAEALSGFLRTDDGENLVQGFKRANNMLTAEEKKDGVEYSFGADIKFAETDEERALFAALDAGEPAIVAAMGAEDFETAMAAMAQLRGPVDAFFKAVKVNADSDVIRRNRLNLLSRISKTCLSVADLTRLEG